MCICLYVMLPIIQDIHNLRRLAPRFPKTTKAKKRVIHYFSLFLSSANNFGKPASLLKVKVTRLSSNILHHSIPCDFLLHKLTKICKFCLIHSKCIYERKHFSTVISYHIQTNSSFTGFVLSQ